MEKPVWRVRASSYVVDSPHMRLRKDEIELPDGTVIPEYYVRESNGFAIVVALTEDGRIVLVSEYRYGADAVGLDLPAGSLAAGEDPRECARRELREETGYEAATFEPLGAWYAEPVRASSRCHAYLARGARLAGEQTLDPTECIDVVAVELDAFRAMLGDGGIASLASIAAGYRALDALASTR